MRRALVYYFLLFFKVCIARDNREGIQLYTKSGKLYHERAATRDLLRYIKTKAASREKREQKKYEASKSERGSQCIWGLGGIWRGGGGITIPGVATRPKCRAAHSVQQTLVQEVGGGGLRRIDMAFESGCASNSLEQGTRQGLPKIVFFPG